MKGLKITRSEERGITLIALVVTIIVLLILATVSISMVTGENGLIKKAEQSREAYENSAQREDANMNEMLKEMAKAEGIIGPHGLPTVNTLTTIQEANVKAEDRQGNKITVPRGFKVRTEYGTSVENGIVIEDASGNQFVWVPCKEGEYKKHVYETTQATDKSSTADTGNGNWKTFYYRQYSDWKDSVDTNANAKSIEENKGFYVGRYEAGVPKEASFYVDEKSDNKEYNIDKDTAHPKNVTKEGEIDLKPVSKAGNQCWNYISQENAKTVSENMYKDDTENNNYGVRSQLIDGVAWDRIAEWMGKEDSKIATDSTTIGNYLNTPQRIVNGLNAIHQINNGLHPATEYKYGNVQIGGNQGTNRIEIATGLVDDFSIKNIYDMAGNMWEWTTEEGYHDVEKTDETENKRTQYAVQRGGGNHNFGNDSPISYRQGNDSTSSTYFDFRVPCCALCEVAKMAERGQTLFCQNVIKVTYLNTDICQYVSKNEERLLLKNK